MKSLKKMTVATMITTLLLTGTITAEAKSMPKSEGYRVAAQYFKSDRQQFPKRSPQSKKSKSVKKDKKKSAAKKSALKKQKHSKKKSNKKTARH